MSTKSPGREVSHKVPKRLEITLKPRYSDSQVQNFLHKPAVGHGPCAEQEARNSAFRTWVIEFFSSGSRFPHLHIIAALAVKDPPGYKGSVTCHCIRLHVAMAVPVVGRARNCPVLEPMWPTSPTLSSPEAPHRCSTPRPLSTGTVLASSPCPCTSVTVGSWTSG